MGVSTLASYRNSYLFEIVGLSEDLCAEFFEDAADFAGQKSLDDLLGRLSADAQRILRQIGEEMPDAGLYRFRKGAELHANSPEVVRRIHAHVKAPQGGQVPGI
jgi:glutamate synthase (NADPH/NADH) large chain